MPLNEYGQFSDDELYTKFQNGEFGFSWPSEQLQMNYTGASGADLVGRARSFISILEKDGAFKDGWKGLDYGCGWGRFASILSGYGGVDQLDLCDAWDETLTIINSLGYKNNIFKVSEVVEPKELKNDTYDFILSFSVFTHLAPIAFNTNIPLLLKSLKKDGKLYITVRHEEFIDYRTPDRVDELRARLEKEKIFCMDAQGNDNGEKVYGDTVVTRDYLERFGNVEYLHVPHQLQHIYAISN